MWWHASNGPTPPLPCYLRYLPYTALNWLFSKHPERTLVERSSRFTILVKMPNRDPIAVARALKQQIINVRSAPALPA